MREFHDMVRDALRYEQETGLFRWRISHGNRRRGQIAGHIDDQGRPKIQVNGERFLQSRLAWYWMKGAWPNAEIDHINENQADNRWCNLREATRSENECNKSLKSNNTSGIKGVRKVGGRWRAEIMKDGKAKHIGYFDTSEAARQAYLDSADKLHGEFANPSPALSARHVWLR